jgi:hypothetical protein
MRYCFDADTLQSNAEFLKKFRTIYETGFPDKNEREDFQVILKRVAGQGLANEPHTIVLMTTTAHGVEVTGGLIADWYSNSRCIHLTYLIISDNFRKNGIARKLIGEGVAWMMDWIKNERGIEIRNVFFESNIPWKTDHKIDNFDASQRLMIFSKLGGKLIDIPYFQPALDPEKQIVANLFLLSFTQFNVTGEKILAGEITEFLSDLYKGLDVPEVKNNTEFKTMQAALDNLKDDNGFVQLRPVPTELEQTVFEFESVSVTFHFIEENDVHKEKGKNTEEPGLCPHFSSFETDLLNFQNQKNQPFNSVLVKPNVGAKLFFPEIYSYTSEGKTHTLRSEKTERDVIVSLSFTQIRLSGKKIWHLTVAPAPGEIFTEYDIIKLATLFGSIQEGSTVRENIGFRAGSPGNGNLSPAELVINLGKIDSGCTLASSATGIVQIDSTEFSLGLEPFFRLFLKQKRQTIEDDKIKLFAKTVCGIILGIFDFERMDEEEIYDTIQPIMPAEQSLMVLCRGTLFKITVDDEIMNSVKDSILVSPYLLVPSTVLAHNEYILSVAREKLTFCLGTNNGMTQKQLEKKQVEINSLINFKYLDGLFQYPTENLIVTQGNIQRGLTFLKSNIESRLKELTAKIDSKRSNFSLFTDSVIALVLFLIAIWEFYKLLSELLHFSQNLVSIVMISVFIVAVYVFVMLKKRT